MKDTRKISIRWFFAALIALFLLSAVLILFHLSNLSRQLAEVAAKENAERYSEALAIFRSRYTSEVVNRVRDHGIEVTHDYLQRPSAIPLPATMTIDLGEHIGRGGSGARVQLFSDFPFPWRSDRRLDEFQTAAMRALRENPDEPYSVIDYEQGMLRYGVADRLRASCVDCHNTHPDSPKTDWREGDVRGVLEVSLPMQPIIEQAQLGTHQTTLLLSTLCGIGGIGLILTMRRVWKDSISLQHRTQEADDALKLQQQTNLELDHQSATLAAANQQLQARTKELTASNQQREERRAALQTALESLETRSVTLQRARETVGDAVQRLSVATDGIRSVQAEQTSGTREQAVVVREIVKSVDHLTDSAERTSARAAELARAAHSSRQVGNAGRNAVEDSRRAMNLVKEKVESIAENVRALSERADVIGNITSTVKEIADQTNLLALNAAIEAARAGEHGKGFAVVATEVKALADQSRKATEQVGRLLEEIQKAVKAAVLSIDQGNESVDAATQTVLGADTTIQSLGMTLTESSDFADEIRAAAGDQAASLSQLRDGIRNIEVVTVQMVKAITLTEQSVDNLQIVTAELSGLTKS